MQKKGKRIIASALLLSLGILAGSPANALTLTFSGSSPLDGADGNIRTFSASGVSVNASAFSRESDGTWATAFLSANALGLGVTDSSEGDGTNNLFLVDNVGRDNYVLFEFSEKIVVDSAFLDNVVNDSDLSVWIGSIDDAFNTHNTLSDGVLGALSLFETNDAVSAGSRLAAFNDGGINGNVLVLAASVTDSTPEDRFLITSVSATVSVPEPWSIALLGLPVFVLAAAGRRRQQGEPEARRAEGPQQHPRSAAVPATLAHVYGIDSYRIRAVGSATQAESFPESCSNRPKRGTVSSHFHPRRSASLLYD